MPNEPEAELPEPLYRRIADDLREKIVSGELRPGARLPTQAELEAVHGISTNTARLAIAVLVNEGLVESLQGRGTFVRRQAPFTALLSAEEGELGDRDRDAFVAAVQAQRRTPGQEKFVMRLQTATPEIAAHLQIAEGAVVVVRSMKRLIDGEPWSFQESFYPQDVAEGTGLMSPHDLPHGTINELARHGHVQVGYRDVVVTRMPTPAEAAFFGRGSGVPVLQVSRTAYSELRPIRLTVTVYAGDLTHLAYEVGKVGAAQAAPVE